MLLKFRCLSEWKKYSLYIVSSMLFLLLFSPYTSLLNDYYGIDSGMYWVIGDGILKGKIPYVELFDHKGPMIFLMWALGVFLGYGTKLGIFVLQVIFLVVDIVLIEKICNIFQASRIKRMAVQGFFLVLLCGTITEGGLTEEWAIPCGFAAIYLVIAYLKNCMPCGVFRCGLLLGVITAYVMWMRVNNGVLPLASVLYISILMIIRRKYVELARAAAGFIVGLLVISAPISLWLLAKGAFEEMVYSSIIYNVMYATDGATGKSAGEIIKCIGYICVTWVLLLTKRKGTEKDVTVFLLMSSILCGVACVLGYTWQHYFMLYLPCMVVSVLYVVKDESWKRAVLWTCIVVLPYSYQIARNAGKCLLFNFAGYYDTLFAQIDELKEVIPQDEMDSVWGIGWKTSKVYAVNGITPCYKVFDMPAVLECSEKLYRETEEMLYSNPPKWIFRFKDEGDPILGFSEYLEEYYIRVSEIGNDSDGLTTVGQEVQLELWKHN